MLLFHSCVQRWWVHPSDGHSQNDNPWLTIARFSPAVWSARQQLISSHVLLTSTNNVPLAFVLPLNDPPTVFIKFSLQYELTEVVFRSAEGIAGGWAFISSSEDPHLCSISSICLWIIPWAPWIGVLEQVMEGRSGLYLQPPNWRMSTQLEAGGRNGGRQSVSAVCRPSQGARAARWRFQQRRRFIP